MVVALALAGCRLEEEPERLPKHAESENTVRLCSDGIDNDGNGLIDCKDPACLELGTLERPGPGRIVCPHVRNSDGSVQLLENNVYTCSDGVDNDDNGYVDCEDNACKGTAACCTPIGAETSLEACSDGVDNDCNGYTDCADFSCRRLNSTGSNAEAFEYCKRFTCGDSCGPETSLEACSDGIDNDGNGYTDCGDYSCTRASNGASSEAIAYCANLVKPPTPENTEALCSDGIDNDLNGVIDCDDESCKGFAYCNPPGGLIQEPPDRPVNFGTLPASERAAILALEKELCTDGIDNDRNGRTDCQEFRCQLASLLPLSGTEVIYQIDCGL